MFSNDRRTLGKFFSFLSLALVLVGIGFHESFVRSHGVHGGARDIGFYISIAFVVVLVLLSFPKKWLCGARGEAKREAKREQKRKRNGGMGLEGGVITVSSDDESDEKSTKPKSKKEKKKIRLPKAARAHKTSRLAEFWDGFRLW